jgi:DNA N-6-adenine-methyltransferase Dam/DUF3102 family protein
MSGPSVSSMALARYDAARLEDQDAAEIGRLYREYRNGMVRSVLCWIEAGQRLAAKKAALGHGQWLPWLADNADALGFGERTAQLLIKDARANPKLASDMTEEQALERSRKIWGHKQPALYSKDSVEWYTPEHYIDAVRECLGSIDLDPASCTAANAVVRAKLFFTQEDNGLEQAWHGRVFMNSPYGVQNGESVAAMFCAKALAEYDSGNIESCIILVNSLHSQAWQAPLYRHPICLVNHRIKFVSGDGKENENPTMQNMFVYLGRQPEKFVRVFSKIGFVMLPAPSDMEAAA